MTATILVGRAVAAQIRGEIAERVKVLAERGITPGLAGILVGEDEASRIYLGAKHKACADVGMHSEQIDLPAYVTEGELLATLRRLNRDPAIHGIIVQLPVPKHISELAVQTTIDPGKDVDGLHPLNVGLMVRGDPTAFPPATSFTSSNRTSPVRPSSVRCTPQSTTTAPGLTMSAEIRPGTPAAAIRMSACRVWEARSRVRMWQIVTVAFPRIESCASMTESGAPTSSPYPTTTTSAPSSSTPLRSRSSTIP